ncbi:MAG: von Willebrand factor type A domain-containing protein [Lachnospiraceae bacterium]|nr:von Willebrand factor type A domain-containing protein [Lachnospiraceae bacterium]
MNLKALISKDYNYKAKYDYYTSLGYTEKASEVLATVTYGDEELKQVIAQMGTTEVIEELHAWLAEREEDTPEEAFAEFGESLLHAENGRRRAAAGRRLRMKGSGILRSILGPGFGGSGGPDGRFIDFGRAGASMSFKGAAPQTMVMYDDADAVMDEMPVDGAVERFAAPSVESTMMMSAAQPMTRAQSPVKPAPTDQYEPIEEKGAQNPGNTPTSTFRMTTNTASVGILLNQIREGRPVNLSQVRLEELMNYFRYQETAPTGQKFKISTEQMKKDNDRELLYIHVGAREETREGQNIVLLLDVSGSMSSQNEVTQLAIAAVVSKLQEGDCLSLITYSSEDDTVLQGYRVRDDHDRELIMGKLLSVVIHGCTNGSAGIETAYRIGEKHYDAGKSNQVILITDGDLNFGITAKDGLTKLIEEKKKTGLFLSVIGTGLYNYKDDKLEILSKHGNGTYCVVNNLEDVRESVDRRYISLTNIVAKDVKAQVEFNPRYVKSYRLLGYENRALAHADFRDDTVISEPYGSGGYGVALYEIDLGGAGESDLKYQKASLTDLEEICTVKVRYKEPLSDTGEELEQAVTPGEESSENLKLAWLLYCIGEKLRKSDRLDDADQRFYEEMKKSKSYREFAAGNVDTLELLMSAIREK